MSHSHSCSHAGSAVCLSFVCWFSCMHVLFLPFFWALSFVIPALHSISAVWRLLCIQALCSHVTGPPITAANPSDLCYTSSMGLLADQVRIRCACYGVTLTLSQSSHAPKLRQDLVLHTIHLLARTLFSCQTLNFLMCYTPHTYSLGRFSAWKPSTF